MSHLMQRDEMSLPESEDYVVAESNESHDRDLVLLPPEGQTIEEYHQRQTGLPNAYVPRSAPEPVEPEPSPLRFSLFELLAAMTFVSIALAAATWLAIETFVGIAGLFTVFFLIVFFVFSQPESRLTKLAWWTLVGTYIVSAGVALVSRLVTLTSNLFVLVPLSS